MTEEVPNRLPLDPHPPRVLLIDDQTLAAEMIQHMLEDQPDITFLHVWDARAALATALAFQPTIVLVDLTMPLIDGFGVIRQFREMTDFQHVPLVLLSSEDTPEQKARGFAQGANDYLIKWPSRLELVARISYHSAAYMAQKQRDDAFVSLQKSQQALLAKTQQLEESQEALHHAQKMEAVGKLTGGVAHDFNNVLQVIGGNLQLMKFVTAGNEKLQQKINAALNGVERGAKLASQLLAFARRQPLQPKIINVGELVRGMHDMLRRAIDESTQIELQIADGVWNILADPNQLENMILNLVINARDAMTANGKIIIEIENFTATAHHPAEAPALLAGEYVRIAVCDNGTGMPDEVVERAFEPFFTTKPTGKGTGLGLSMAYGFVKQSNGHIELKSRVGHGTTVHIHLPRANEAATGIARPLSEQSSVLNGNETVLVVEDEPEVRATTVEILNSLGYQTLQAEDAQSALSILQTGRQVDLLFTDVVMPGPLRSDELAGEARRLYPEIGILFASGYTDGRIVEDGNLIPGTNLLTKPYGAENLSRKVREVLDQVRRI